MPAEVSMFHNTLSVQVVHGFTLQICHSAAQNPFGPQNPMPGRASACSLRISIFKHRKREKSRYCGKIERCGILGQNKMQMGWIDEV